jgi:molybdopterin molybdotransferase
MLHFQLTCDNKGLPAPASSKAISYEQARAIVIREVAAKAGAPVVETTPLEMADGRVLARDVFADRPYPTLDRTARDGFAVRSEDMPGRVRVIGEVRAGERFERAVGVGEAVEIMTGAPVPDGADAVVMVEHVEREGDWMVFDGAVPPGQFINFRGGEAQEGALLLRAGTPLGYCEVALLASVGVATVPVFARRKVAIVTTGDELVMPDQTPLPHQIRNSNGYSLMAQVSRAGGFPDLLGVARDDLGETQGVVDRGLTADLLLISGGVSAGKYDVVEQALQSFGATIFFDRVAIQPGQPLVFGWARGCFFFGLPGNPASTVVTFELFARTALEMLNGCPAREPVFSLARLAQSYRHKPGLRRFLPAVVSSGGELTPIAWTGSSDIASLTRANAFMVVDPERAEWNAGEMMPVLFK